MKLDFRKAGLILSIGGDNMTLNQIEKEIENLEEKLSFYNNMALNFPHLQNMESTDPDAKLLRREVAIIMWQLKTLDYVRESRKGGAR
jgi:hypothetical protein